MRENLLAALAPREEKLELQGEKLVVRELESAADTEAFRDEKDVGYKLLVRCTFNEAGEAVFTDADIPRLKGASRTRIGPLIKAVNRVNGFDVEAEAKKSEAAPAGG